MSTVAPAIRKIKEEAESKIAKYADILARHNAGESHSAIARSYGCTRQNVFEILKRIGAEPRRKQQELSNSTGMTVRMANDPEKRQLIKRAAGHVILGMSYGKAARKVGLDEQHVRLYCRSVGIVSEHRSRNPNIRSFINDAEARNDA